MEDHIHHHLEGSGGVSQSEEHNHWFEEPFGGEEGCFPFVTFFYADVVISPSYVELGEEGAAGKAVDRLRYERGYVAIFLGPPVDWSVVLDWTKFSVFLFNEEEIGCVGTP